MSRSETTFWRLSKSRFQANATTGDAASRFGGRWNPPGAPVVYCSTSLALAQREVLLHLGDTPRFIDYAAIRLDAPLGVSIETVEPSSLPPGWNALRAPPATQDLGRGWLQSARSCVLRVPSVLSPSEWTALINPRHPEFVRIVVSVVPLAITSPAESAAPAQDVPTRPGRVVFLCHASEDKREIVEPLKRALEADGISIWMDDDQIRWGDSISAKINAGLSRSQFVLVVLSKVFLTKPYAMSELHAALSHELSFGELRVLPLFVGSDDDIKAIRSVLPMLAGKKFLRWEGSPEPIVERLAQRSSDP